MWTTYNRQIILSRLTKMMDTDTSVVIWQNSKDIREKFSGEFISLDNDNAELNLNPEYLKADYPIIKGQQLFFHCYGGEILFKRDAFQLDDLGLVLKTPAELMIKELRKFERFYFKYQDYKCITFDFKEQIISEIIIDLSVEGVGVLLPLYTAKDLHNGSKIKISHISDQGLPDVVPATIVYKTILKNNGELSATHIKLGIKFDEGLDSITYKSICSIVEKKQKLMEGIETSYYNGLLPNQIEKNLAQIAEKSRPLANNLRDQIENIDRLRYLTTKMKIYFLREVSLDLLATALRLSSKELIFELFSDVSETMREEFLQKLDVAKPPSAINKAQDEISKIMATKEATGEIILSPEAFSQLV